MTGQRAVTMAFAAATVALVGCGGGERQDADEEAATYTVDISDASFPTAQRLAKPAQMRIAVKNTGDTRIPDVAVTVDSFYRRSQQPGLADPERPVWIIDEGPLGGSTALVNTWALQGLAPGQTKMFRWTLTPVESGRYAVKYTVATGLDGRAQARNAKGTSSVTGTFRVRISQRPSTSRVNPSTGEVERTEG